MFKKILSFFITPKSVKENILTANELKAMEAYYKAMNNMFDNCDFDGLNTDDALVSMKIIIDYFKYYDESNPRFDYIHANRVGQFLYTMSNMFSHSTFAGGVTTEGVWSAFSKAAAYHNQ